MTRKEQLQAAYENLEEAAKLLASAGLLLWPRRSRSWPYRLISKRRTKVASSRSWAPVSS